MNDQPNNTTVPDKQIQKKEPSTAQRKRSRKKSVDNAVVVAAISAVVTIILAFLGFPPFSKWLDSKLNPVPTIAITETFTPMPSEPPTVTLEISPTPGTATTGITEAAIPSTPETFTPLPTNAPITPIDRMNVILIPTWYTGKAPLLVNFNVRESFITFANGTTFSCISTRKACTFSWTVSREGQVIYGPEQGESVFPYRFEKKGKHRLFVYICHDQTCSSASADIEVK
jgi:hypothetical protein